MVDLALENNHCFYIGMSGSGKSQVLKQSGEIPSPNKARIVVWDAKPEHLDADQFETFESFARALFDADRSGRGFKISLHLSHAQRTPDNHELFCEIVASILRSDKLTYVIDEELSRSCRSSSKADYWHGYLIEEGRSKGLVYHGVIQYPQYVPKQVLRGVKKIYAGQHADTADYIKEKFPDDWKEFQYLSPLEFLVWEMGKREIVRKQYKYKKF